MNQESAVRNAGVDDATVASMQINPRDELLATLSKRLLGCSSASETFMEPLPGVEGPFQDYNDFRARALKPVDELVRICECDGHAVKIVLREGYACRLAEVRELRLRAGQSSLNELVGDRMPAAKQQEAEAGATLPALSPEEARARLSQHELRNRILPEELVALLDALPESSYFSRVFLLDEANPEDLWVRQTYNPGFVSAAATLPNGDLLLFRTERNEFLRVNLIHEWAHQLQRRCEAEFKIFHDAVELGWRFYVPNTYALRSYEEHWAVIGEELLHVDARRFLAAAGSAPIRSTVWMLVLRRALAKSTGCGLNLYRDQLNARVIHTLQHVLPKARQALESFAQSGEPEQQGRALRVLQFLEQATASTDKTGSTGSGQDSLAVGTDSGHTPVGAR